MIRDRKVGVVLAHRQEVMRTMQTATDDEDVQRRAAARVTAVAATTSSQLDDVARMLHLQLAESILELRGDPIMLDLLHASVRSNVETFFHLVQYGVDVESVEAPWAAVEYARRLAQREVSSNALLRAYRLGQSHVLDWIAGQLRAVEPDDRVCFSALRMLQGTAFAYIDRVSEHVVAEYETERERWLANRNTIRSATLGALLSGEEMDVVSGERALGYRLRQGHLGLVLWVDERTASPAPLQRLGQLVTSFARELGSEASALFVPQDRTLGWAWVPVPAGTSPDLEGLERTLRESGDDVEVAVGAVGQGLAGFRSTHQDALRAREVAVVGGRRGRRVTSFADPGVRTAAILARDLPAARELVDRELGGLARDDENLERLRETLAIFLGENRSYVATAEKVHLHRNTVKYRVDKAVQVRGRPVEEDRFDLELALLACRWLGPAVLT